MQRNLLMRFCFQGAAPGDTLVVRILKLTPNRSVAISIITL